MTPIRNIGEVDIHRLQRAFGAVNWRWYGCGVPSVEDLNLMIALLFRWAEGATDTLWVSSGGIAASRAQLLRLDPTIEAAYTSDESSKLVFGC
jgi:hypothetical protein